MRSSAGVLCMLMSACRTGIAELDCRSSNGTCVVTSVVVLMALIALLSAAIATLLTSNCSLVTSAGSCAGASWHISLLLHVQHSPCALLSSLSQFQIWHQNALPVSGTPQWYSQVCRAKALREKKKNLRCIMTDLDVMVFVYILVGFRSCKIGTVGA